MMRAHWRDQVIVAVVAGITAIYGAVLVQVAQLVTDLSPDDGTIGVTIFITAIVFIGLGAYSAAVVTANSFATVIAGRIRQIAQYRLLGATATSLRAKLAGEGIVAGLIGALAGLVAGIGGYALVVRLVVDAGNLPDIAYTYVSWRPVVPAAMVIVTVAIAAWIGTRPVTRVSPVQALAQSVEVPLDLSSTPVVQRVLAILGLVAGVVLLLGGAALGALMPLGLFVAFLGGVASFTGFVIGARMFVPGLLRLVGRAFGRGAAASLASSNAVRSPRAATRSTIGMIVGVTLIVMFIVAIAVLRRILTDAMTDIGLSPDEMVFFELVLDMVTWVAVALVGVSAVIGAAGMIASLSLSVLQRQRELGLLRAIGATAGQVRASIALESVITSIVAIGTGFVLGVAYGWLGAQSTLGAVAGGIVPLVVPWWLLVGVGGVTLVLALVAAVAPAARATRVTPIQALAVE